MSNKAVFLLNIKADTMVDLNRTTIACESFHFHFNKSYHSIHPYIFTFFNKFNQIKLNNLIRINSINE